MASTPPSSSRTLIIGLSGPSSSGKSTLARLLRSIFNINLLDRTLGLFILHEDDFYKPDDQIPIKNFNSTANGRRELADWDCAEAMDFPLFERTLQHVHDHGKLPEDMYSKEDQNELGDSHVANEAIQQAKLEAEKWFAGLRIMDDQKHIQLCILDGFLLYTDPSNPSIPVSITDLLDVKLFLRTTLTQTVQRREKRAGYVTLGDFWVDPPGYVEDVVWPNYVSEHVWMFKDGDVDKGEITEKVKEEGLLVGPGMGDRRMGELMEWGIEVVKQEIEKKRG